MSLDSAVGQLKGRWFRKIKNCVFMFLVHWVFSDVLKSLNHKYLPYLNGFIDGIYSQNHKYLPYFYGFIDDVTGG